MEKFTITVDMVTPAIISSLTLDGLLGAVLFDELQDVDQAHAAIPLRCSDGLYHASVAHPVGVVELGKHGLIAGLRATHDLDPSLIKQGKGGQPHRHMGLTRRSDFGNVMNGYQTLVAQSIQWHAEGDADQVLDLLQELEFIGEKRTAGFGQVRGWQLAESDLDGIADAAGQPLRPVPLAMWHGDPNAIRADAAWRPAYWLPQHRAICAVPKGVAP
ncbi:MAG: hypothetical protein RIS34_1363 [Pseudomonadota bacterium]